MKNIYCVLGDLDRWVGGKVRVGINIVFGVPGENDNGRRVELCVGKPYFECKSLHK